MCAASTALQPDRPDPRPDPHQDRPAIAAGAPKPTSRLLTLVRALIDFGKQLATTLQQRRPATAIADITWNSGTLDIAHILACVTRGLLRAAALEARLTARVERQPVAPAALGAPSPRQPRAARSAPSSPISVATSVS